MTGRVLRIVRIVVSFIAAAILTASAAGLALPLSGFAEWLERIQIFPAVLSFSMAVFVSWLIITLIFGRVYCSSVCPLGFLMDISARSVRITRRQRMIRHYAWRRPVSRLQYVVLVVSLVAMMCGISYVVSLVDPFTIYCDLIGQVFVPAARSVEATTAAVGEMTGWWSLSAPDRVLSATLAGSVVSVILLTAVIAVSVLSGRTLCNTVCPVGTTLGLISRYAVMQIDIDTDLCTRCGACRDVCKASCIDPVNWTVDGARCVDCFDCLTVCENDAIHYTGRRHQLSDVLMQRVGSAREAGTAATSAMSDELQQDNQK